MKVGFYESDIMPPISGFMVGCWNSRRAEVVHDRLYAKAMVVDNEGKTSAFLSLDTCEL